MNLKDMSDDALFEMHEDIRNNTPNDLEVEIIIRDKNTKKQLKGTFDLSIFNNITKIDEAFDILKYEFREERGDFKAVRDEIDTRSANYMKQLGL